MARLDDQVAIVTGGSSGIGAGVARSLAAAGANVVVNFHSGEDNANAVVDDIVKAGGNAVAIGANVGEEEDVLALYGQAVDAFGRVDILIANSGIQKDAAFADMTMDDWNAVMSVNLTGQFLTAREAIKQFRKQGHDADRSSALGKIICMSSVHEIIPWAGHINYASSKGGVRLLMQSLAQEVAGEQIRVNSIAPGAIQTPINESVWGDEAKRKELMKLIPYGRIGKPDDIGRAAVWLSSDESDYITGQTIFIDGGMTLYPGFIGNG